VFDAGTYDTPATKQAADALAKWAPKTPILVVVDAEELGAMKSFRNLPSVSVIAASSAGVADVIGHASLAVSERALEVLEAKAGAEVKRGGGSE
jgi:large subunit ribosomal protein L4